MVPESGACRVLTLLGVFYLGKVAVSLSWQAFLGFRAHVLSKVCPRIELLDKYGRWAVVTGCTSGIGRAYTVELAQRGVNVVLISRNLDKLHALAIEIENDYSIETKVIQADFSDGRNIYQRIANELSSIDIGILVNNVGVLGEHPLYLSELKEHDIWQMINVNVGATTMMTRIVLPAMLRRRCGAIVNISSMAARKPVPLLSVYSGSKAYCSFLSEALSEECRGSGVTIQTIEPAWINTAMIRFSNMLRNGNACFIPTPEQFAHSAIATLGQVDHTSGYWLHGLLTWFVDATVPTWLWLRSSHWIYRGFRMEGQNCSRFKSKVVEQAPI